MEIENCRIWCSGSQPVGGEYLDLGDNCIRTDCQSCDPKADDDKDGVPNDQDICPDHDDNIDTDGDETPDGCDECPNDPLKVVSGLCGCGTPDVDSDRDGTLDCDDGCPNDAKKTEPGNCECHVPETTVFGDLDCDGDYDEDDARTAMAQYGITEGFSPGDADADGDVDLDDREALNALLGTCAADINGDGQVNGVDLGLFLGAWGVCASP